MKFDFHNNFMWYHYGVVCNLDGYIDKERSGHGEGRGLA